MRFKVSLSQCDRCRHRVSPGALRLVGSDQAWAFTGSCANCQAPLAFTFRTKGDPHGPLPSGELGGPEPSEILTLTELAAEVERLAPLVPADPTSLEPAVWREGRDANWRLGVCLKEIAKMPQALQPEGPLLAWLQTRREAYDSALAAFVADVPRIDALERPASAATRRPIEISREMGRAHEAWVKRGGVGEGRLELTDAVVAAGTRIGAAELRGARLSHAVLAGVDLGYAHLDGAELRGSSLANANLTGASLRRAQVEHTSFDAAAMALAKLDDASVSDARFVGADLDRSQWCDAHVRDTVFDGARFGNAALDRATFERCSFRGTDLSPTTRAPVPTTQGARFIDCDLRESRWSGRDVSLAEFVRCHSDGAEGMAKLPS
jgi:uncharacterized protein YjbI with pentapeptide repeats